MPYHRENFERVTKTVAPAFLIRESDEAEADRFFGLSRLNRTSEGFHGRGEPDRFAKKLLGAM